MALTQEDFDAIALSIKTSLEPDLELLDQQYTLVREIHQLLGLNRSYPLVVTQTERKAGKIVQSIVLDAVNKTTLVTRLPQYSGVGYDIVGETVIGEGAVGLPLVIGSLRVGEFKIN